MGRANPGLSLLLLSAALAGCGASAHDSAAAAADTTRPGDVVTTPESVAFGPPPPCEPGNGGITLPEGFCAIVVADGLGAIRHIAVAPNGDVYAARMRRGNNGPPAGVVALRDTTGDGKADVVEAFGATGGSGVALHGEHLYFAQNDAVLRWRMTPGQLVPQGAPDTLVTGLPTGGHSAKSLAFDGQGGMYVAVGSQTNSCQQADRQNRSPGHDPCTELQTRAGVWRFAADRTGQRQADAEHYATGLRNPYAITWADGALWATVHGRDQLSANWGFSEQDNAELPAEEIFRLERGADGGWPYCYQDGRANRKVMAPEYGGDGQQVGRCGDKLAPVASFPAHWAPNAMVVYTGTQFPERYRNGAFVAFHGSWNRAPLPQAGYNVAFLPMSGGRATGAHEVFADGFAGATPTPSGAHRPTGLAVGPDGSLYVSDDAGGRIWRIVYATR